MSEEELKSKLVTLSKILTKEGLFGAFGHVSVRIPGKKLYYITPGMFANKNHMTTKDLVSVDFKGNKVSGANRPPREAVIHTVLHRSREDAVAIAHLHPFYATTLSVSGIKFVPLNTHGRIFKDNLPIYQDTDLIVVENEGINLAKVAGNAKAILLRGHGVVIVGKSIEELLFVTMTLEEESRRAIETAHIRTLLPLTAEEFRQQKNRSDEMDQGSKKMWETCVAELQ